MRTFRKTTLFRLLALLLVVGLMVGCFAGCRGQQVEDDDDDDDDRKTTVSQKETTEATEDTTESTGESTEASEDATDASEEPTSATEEPTDATEEPTDATEEPTDATEEPTDASTEPTVAVPDPMEVGLNGLILTLDNSYELIDEEEGRLIYSGDSANLTVTFKTIKDWGCGATTSAEFADWYEDSIDPEDYDYVLNKEADGVSYLVCVRTSGTVVYGFYVHDRVGWMVKASGMDQAYLVGIATGGEIDEAAIPDIVEPITLKVWTPYEDQLEDNNWLAQMQARFEAEHPEWDITWVNECLSEGDAAGMVSSDPAAAADVYMFANDQLGYLVSCGGLMQLGGDYAQQVRDDNNDFMEYTVTGADDALYGFPVEGNTWFLYYNKDYYTEEDVKSLDTMLSKGKVSVPLDIGWYSGTFFLGCGGTVFGEKGNDASAGIQFGEKNGGYVAARKMVELAENPNVVCRTGVGKLIDGEVAAGFSGVWDYQSAYEVMGDKLGVAVLPFFTAEGKTYQMKALSGSMCIGVNATTTVLDSLKQQVAMEFAAYLASSEAQLTRYTMTGTIPASTSLLENPLIRDNPVAMAVINTINNCSVVQSALPEMANYWSPVDTFGNQVINGEIFMHNYEIYVDEMMRYLNSGWR